MTTLKITPSQLSGKLTIPPSKSHTTRAILFGCLGDGKTTIRNYLKSPDSASMIKAMRAFGAQIEVDSERIEITGSKLRACDGVIDAGNSGQVLRFVGSLAALLPTSTTLTGDHRRPVQPLLSALDQLGARTTAPMTIQGPIRPGRATLLGEDSQPVSGLLIATSFLSGTTHLHVTNPGEKPWIDLTLSWLHRLGAKVSHENYEHYKVTGPLNYPGFEMTIPGDFSSAAFPIVAALITNSTLTLENIDMQEIQGDKKIIEILMQMGMQFENFTVCGNGQLMGMKIDANEIIDAVPILAVIGCFAKGRTEIVNAAIARKKESDRIHTITLELRKMGAQIEEKEDGLIITPSPLKGAKMNSHNDHRIAMALSVAALAAEGESHIEGTDCIAKSYPSFISDFQKVGGDFET